MNMGLLQVASVIVAIFLGSAFGQLKPNAPLKPLTVCEALRDVKHLNGRVIAIRGLFHFTQKHGGWLLDQDANGEPCRNMPRKARVWMSGVWLESLSRANLDGKRPTNPS